MAFCKFLLFLFVTLNGSLAATRPVFSGLSMVGECGVTRPMQTVYSAFHIVFFFFFAFSVSANFSRTAWTPHFEIQLDVLVHIVTFLADVTSLAEHLKPLYSKCQNLLTRGFQINETKERALYVINRLKTF